MDLSTMTFSVDDLEAMAGQVDLVRQDVNDTTEVHPPVPPTKLLLRFGVSEHWRL